jgi:hypothetical protein
MLVGFSCKPSLGVLRVRFATCCSWKDRVTHLQTSRRTRTWCHGISSTNGTLHWTTHIWIYTDTFTYTYLIHSVWFQDIKKTWYVYIYIYTYTVYIYIFWWFCQMQRFYTKPGDAGIDVSRNGDPGDPGRRQVGVCQGVCGLEPAAAMWRPSS